MKFLIILTLLVTPCFAGEITPPTTPPPESLEALGNLPHSVAVQLPDDLYFWWAKAHNERVQKSQTTSEYVGSRTRYNQTRSRNSNRYNSDVEIQSRRFYSRSYTPPAMIYNPFYRGD